MDNKIKFAGDIYVDSIVIKSLASSKSIDIKNQVMGINIYEDIFSPFITGSLSIRDSVDLANALPFIGEEVISLSLKTPGMDIGYETEFYVYKCTDREYTGDRSVIYSLYFISKEAITDINTKISRALSGTFDEIIKQLVITDVGLNTDKKLDYEFSSGKTKFVCNFWNPIDAITYVCKSSVSRSGSPSYLFFESREGFNFKSLENLYIQNSIQEFNYSNFSRIVGKNTTYRDIDIDYKRIISISVPKAFDYMTDIANGAYSSKKFTWDVTTKQYKLEAFDYFKEFYESRHLNPYPAVSPRLNRKFNSFISMDIDHYEVHTGYSTPSTESIDNQYRQSILLQANSNTVNITVPGRFDYTVGKKVSLKLFKNEPITSAESEDEILDKIYSGNYIISAVNHSIYRDRHECNIELMKDSYMFDVTKGN